MNVLLLDTLAWVLTLVIDLSQVALLMAIVLVITKGRELLSMIGESIG